MVKLSPKKLQRSAFLAALTIVALTLLDETPFSTNTSILKRQVAITEQDEAATMGDVADFVDDADTAVYWHIPKASGSSMKGYYACLGLVEATQLGITEGHDQDETLEVWENIYGQKYVNVDTTREDGILHAKNLHLAQSNLADVLFTEYPAIATQMFTPQNQGRFFTLLRHPIERTVSLFYYRQIAKWEKHEGVYKPDLAALELEDFAKRKIESKDNGGFMVSLLVNKSRREPLTDDDLQKAKEILRTKFVIGLTSKMEESVNRFDNYFGWHDTLEDKKRRREECLDLYIRRKKKDNNDANEDKSNANSYKHVQEGSEAWNLLAEFHYFDMQLYEFALQLFEEQGHLLGVQNAWDDYEKDGGTNDNVPAVGNVPEEGRVSPAESNVPPTESNVETNNIPEETKNIPIEKKVPTESANPAEGNIDSKRNVPVESA